MAKLTLSDLANLQNEVSVVTAINNNNTAIETALENTLSRDGTSPNTMESSLDMNSNRILNLPDAGSNQEPVTLAQFNEGVTIANLGTLILPGSSTDNALVRFNGTGGATLLNSNAILDSSGNLSLAGTLSTTTNNITSTTGSHTSTTGNFTSSSSGNFTTSSGNHTTTSGNLVTGTGRALVGRTTSSAETGKVQVVSDNSTDWSLALFGVGAGDIGPNIAFNKTRHATDSDAFTILQNGDQVGGLSFRASDGVNYEEVASIDVVVDGVPGSNDVPGAIVFSTTPDGSVTPAQRLKIGNSGNVTLQSTTGKLGYGSGTGGQVTQLTNKSASVTLDRPTGFVITTNDSLASLDAIQFGINNSLVEATDLVVVNHVSGGTFGAYVIQAECDAGAIIVSVRNVTLGALAEAINIGFVLIKGASS